MVKRMKKGGLGGAGGAFAGVQDLLDVVVGEAEGAGAEEEAGPLEGGDLLPDGDRVDVEQLRDLVDGVKFLAAVQGF